VGYGPKQRASVEEILASTSDVLFPAELGARTVEIDSTDNDRDTPLHVMVWRKDRDAVDLLIGAGANVDAVGDMGETPLHVAVSREDLPVIEAVLKSGAKTDIRSEFNETAAGRAEKKGGKIASLFKQYTRA
jgi:ankyrin repeat protein